MGILLKEDTGLLRPATLFDHAGQESCIRGERIHLVGFGFDGTACFRKGAAKGPGQIREATVQMESYSPYLNRCLLETDFVDLGDIPVETPGDFKTATIDGIWRKANSCFYSLLEGTDWKKQKAGFLVLGGEHSISYAPIVSYLKEYPDLILLHLDAHGDLRESYQGFECSHAAVIRHVLGEFGENHELMQYGIRSGTKEEFEFMRSKKTLFSFFEEWMGAIEKIPSDRPLYLTLDLDYFDPAYCPGTGTPEPGGETFDSYVQLMKILCQKNLVGADVVELSGELDPTGNSDVFAAKVVRELVLSMGVGGR